MTLADLLRQYRAGHPHEGQCTGCAAATALEAIPQTLLDLAVVALGVAEGDDIEDLREALARDVEQTAVGRGVHRPQG